MKIAYIISTCDKYLESRVKFQKEIMFKNINKEDIYYLTSQSNIDKRHFGWNCLDDCQNITWKYIYFIYHMEIQDKYDWFILIDDDTFVFDSRLQKMLSQYNSENNYYIGKELDHIKNEFCLYMSGGAGYCISKSLYKLIKSHIMKLGINECYYIRNLKEQFCDDLCIGLWIQDIAKDNKVEQINNDLFHIGLQEDDSELKTAITFHKVIKEEQYIFYQKIVENESIEIKKQLNKEVSTVVVLISDEKYFHKAKRTIIDLRSIGKWHGDIVLITIDFDLNQNFKDFYTIIEKKFYIIDKTNLINQIGCNGFQDTIDKREIDKINQWEKLHVFDSYFLKWSKVIYLDAGLRVLDDVKYLIELNCKNKLLAPIDGKINKHLSFHCQISNDNSELINILENDFGKDIFIDKYMLNCLWIYDSSILNIIKKEELIESMNKYTCCKSNEMGIMNLIIHFKYHLWDCFPIMASNGKYLFDWSDGNNQNTNWRDYCLLKYPISISFEDT